MIGFNRPYTTGKELNFINEAAKNSQLAGDGVFTRKCSKWLEDEISCCKALLTHSCTAALEMAAILAAALLRTDTTTFLVLFSDWYLSEEKYFLSCN